MSWLIGEIIHFLEKYKTENRNYKMYLFVYFSNLKIKMEYEKQEKALDFVILIFKKNYFR